MASTPIGARRPVTIKCRDLSLFFRAGKVKQILAGERTLDEDLSPFTWARSGPSIILIKSVETGAFRSSILNCVITYPLGIERSSSPSLWVVRS